MMMKLAIALLALAWGLPGFTVALPTATFTPDPGVLPTKVCAGGNKLISGTLDATFDPDTTGTATILDTGTTYKTFSSLGLISWPISGSSACTADLTGYDVDTTKVASTKCATFGGIPTVAKRIERVDSTYADKLAEVFLSPTFPQAMYTSLPAAFSTSNVVFPVSGADGPKTIDALYLVARESKESSKRVGVDVYAVNPLKSSEKAFCCRIWQESAESYWDSVVTTTSIWQYTYNQDTNPPLVEYISLPTGPFYGNIPSLAIFYVPIRISRASPLDAFVVQAVFTPLDGNYEPSGPDVIVETTSPNPVTNAQGVYENKIGLQFAVPGEAGTYWLKIKLSQLATVCGVNDLFDDWYSGISFVDVLVLP